MNELPKTLSVRLWYKISKQTKMISSCHAHFKY